MQISLTCSEGWKVNFIYVFFSVDLVLPSLFVLSVTTAHKLSQQLLQGCFQREVSGSSTGVELDPQTDEKLLCFNQFLSTCGAISDCFQESNGAVRLRSISLRSQCCVQAVKGCWTWEHMQSTASDVTLRSTVRWEPLGAIGAHCETCRRHLAAVGKCSLWEEAEGAEAH